jgi:hypothetical protein
MIIVRFLTGFFKALVSIWSQEEWFYYAKTGLDPKLPAFQRWEVSTRVEDKVPDNDAERLMPLKNRWVMLKDKFMLAPDEIVFFTTDADKVENLLEGYRRELRTRSSGEFYYKMVKGRNLDYFHTAQAIGEPMIEGTEIDEDQKREMFHR